MLHAIPFSLGVHREMLHAPHELCIVGHMQMPQLSMRVHAFRCEDVFFLYRRNHEDVEIIDGVRLPDEGVAFLIGRIKSHRSGG